VTKRSLVSTIASTLLALTLVIALFRVSHVDVAHVWRLVLSARPWPLLVLVLMTGLQVVLASEKWRLVEQQLAGSKPPPRRLCLALTALGTAAGQVLPLPVATALCRSLGSQILIGSGAVRGAVGTMFEQSFDFLVVCLLALASIGCLRAGDAVHFAGLAFALISVALVLVGPTARLTKAGVLRLAAPGSVFGIHVQTIAATLVKSGLIDPRLARRLFILSALRFIALCLMAGATTEAVGLDVPLLQLAAALPLVMLASTLAATPAAIGVNEWAFVAVLMAFGTPLDIATQWAIANRILVAAASLVVGVLGTVLVHPPGRKDVAMAARAADQGARPSAGAATGSAPQDSPAM